MAEILDGTASGSRGFLSLFLCLNSCTDLLTWTANHSQIPLTDEPLPILHGRSALKSKKGPSMQPTAQDTLHRLVTLTTLSPILTALEQVRSREAPSHNPQDSSQPQLWRRWQPHPCFSAVAGLVCVLLVEMAPQWVWLVAVLPTDARSDWDQDGFEVQICTLRCLWCSSSHLLNCHGVAKWTCRIGGGLLKYPWSDLICSSIR